MGMHNQGLSFVGLHLRRNSSSLLWKTCSLRNITQSVVRHEKILAQVQGEQQQQRRRHQQQRQFRRNDEVDQPILLSSFQRSFHDAQPPSPTKKDGGTTVDDHVNRTMDRVKTDYMLQHPIWTDGEVHKVVQIPRPPRGFSDRCAWLAVAACRVFFDLFSGYTFKNKAWSSMIFGPLTEKNALSRCLYLETIGGVPGFTAAWLRNLRSLRLMKRDHGWIHTLIEESENERMHLLTFLALKNPGPIFKLRVAFTQITFTTCFFLGYIISPHFCHRFVGYLEDEAVGTYTLIINDIDSGRFPTWSTLPAPEVSINYWQLPPTATMRDVILRIRADEAHHRDINHIFGSIKLDADNPYEPGAGVPKKVDPRENY